MGKPPVSGSSDRRGERIRTSDTLVPNQVRYQAALRPVATGLPHAARAARYFFLPLGAGFGAGAGVTGTSAEGALGVLPPAQAK